MQWCHDAAAAAGATRTALWKPRPLWLARRKVCAGTATVPVPGASAGGASLAISMPRSLSKRAASEAGRPHVRARKTKSPPVRSRANDTADCAGKPAPRSSRSRPKKRARPA
eukprot:170872-Alexandrium_andersonii.AAC.1